jgi:hypothetical protein
MKRIADKDLPDNLFRVTKTDKNDLDHDSDINES